MNLKNRLKGINRTFLEMQTGLIVWGIICNGVGAFFVKNQSMYAKSIWFGIIFALASNFHMYRNLDRALDFDEKNATKLIFRGYVTRYFIFALILGILMYTNVLNPLVVFLAYMGLKMTAYMQPIIHIIYNKIFNETDPIPKSLEEIEKEEETHREEETSQEKSE